MQTRFRVATIQMLLARRGAGQNAHAAALSLCAQAGRYYMARQMRIVRLEAAQEAQRLSLTS